MLYQIDSSDMQTTIERAEISAKSAQRSYETAVKDLDNLNVKTKVGGVVTDVLVEVGDQVSAGQEIAKVRDSATMTIELPFPADEADTFYIGQSAQVTLYGSFETLSGKVESISGASEVKAGNKIVKNVTISVENPGAISEEQIATAEVGTSGSTQSGKFKYNENRSVNAEVSGEVVAIVNDEGSEVSSGSTIIRLESDNVTNSVQSASDSVKDAQLSLENQYETLEDYTIKSPIKGTVIEKKKKAGDTIDSNAELCTIYDLSYLKMTMNIDELDISKVKVGQEVTVTADAVQGQTFKGKVTKINMAGTTTNGVTTYPVEVQTEDTEGLLPGMNVSTEITLARTGKRRYNHFVPSQRADSPRQGETEEVFLCCAREKSRSRSLTACTIRRRPGSSRLPTALPALSASYTATTTSMPKACWVCSPCPSERGRGSRSPQTERMPERRWMRWGLTFGLGGDESLIQFKRYISHICLCPCQY